MLVPWVGQSAFLIVQARKLKQPSSRPNPALHSDPACIAFRSLSSFRFLGFVQRLGAGGAGELQSLGAQLSTLPKGVYMKNRSIGICLILCGVLAFLQLACEGTTTGESKKLEAPQQEKFVRFGKRFFEKSSMRKVTLKGKEGIRLHAMTQYPPFGNDSVGVISKLNWAYRIDKPEIFLLGEELISPKTGMPITEPVSYLSTKWLPIKPGSDDEGLRLEALKIYAAK